MSRKFRRAFSAFLSEHGRYREAAIKNERVASISYRHCQQLDQKVAELEIEISASQEQFQTRCKDKDAELSAMKEEIIALETQKEAELLAAKVQLEVLEEGKYKELLAATNEIEAVRKEKDAEYARYMEHSAITAKQVRHLKHELQEERIASEQRCLDLKRAKHVLRRKSHDCKRLARELDRGKAEAKELHDLRRLNEH